MDNFYQGGLGGADVLPLGLAMALAQNSDALNFFGRLSEPERQTIIMRTHDIKSKEEMRELVDSLG